VTGATFARHPGGKGANQAVDGDAFFDLLVERIATLG